MSISSGVYHINLGNDYFYIGSAVNTKSREQNHRNTLLRNDHRNRFVQRCWNKYGVFQFTILEKCPVVNLIVCEQTYLDQYFDDPKNTNIHRIAGSPLGITRSSKTREKISVARKGIQFSPEHCANISAALKGKTQLAESNEKRSVALKGKKLSPEHRAKLLVAKQNVSDGTRAKQSAAAKLRHANNPESDETRERKSASAKLRPPISEITRAKIAAASRNISDETRVKRSVAIRKAKSK